MKSATCLLRSVVPFDHCFSVPFQEHNVTPNSPCTCEMVPQTSVIKRGAVRLLGFFAICNLTQDVQVDWRGFHQSNEHFLNVLDVEALLWLPLPTAQHHVIHLLGAEPGALQHSPLRNALDHLLKEKRGKAAFYCT